MLYFAYGSNMDPPQMAERCPGARAFGPARLADHTLLFTRDSPGWGGGVASVGRAGGEDVWGVLWDITAPDEESLDDYEGVDVGAYRKEVLEVEHAGRREKALVYVANPRGRKAPSKRYVAALVRGAEAHGLPPAYVTKLRDLAR